jgi:SAM-dependent methyltransferase
MKTLDESVALAMDGESTEIVPFLPYILQDFYELGSSAESILEIVRTNTTHHGDLKILDLGCGKGAVSHKLSESLGCSCLGIDAVPEFIEDARAIARKARKGNCFFLCADIRKEVTRIGIFDVIILGAIGPVFGNYYETMEVLKNNLGEKGIIVLDDGYVAEESGFHHESVGTRAQLINELEKAGMRILREYMDEADSHGEEYGKQFSDIARRCHELELLHPGKKGIFEAYIARQKEEYANLEHDILCSTMVIGRK